MTETNIRLCQASSGGIFDSKTLETAVLKLRGGINKVVAGTAWICRKSFNCEELFNRKRLFDDSESLTRSIKFYYFSRKKLVKNPKKNQEVIKTEFCRSLEVRC